MNRSYLIALVIPLLLLAACTVIPILKKTTLDERRWLLSGKPLSDTGISAAELPDETVMELSDEMVGFLAQPEFHQGTGSLRLLRLARALVSEEGLAIRYDPVATLTAAETFRQRRANCLSFTTITVAMARHLGLEAHFNEVDVPEIWDLQNSSTFVLYKHINTVVDIAGGPRQLLDISIEEYDNSFDQRIISDRLAIAQYYNNRAMEFLYAQSYRDSYRYLLKALTLEPGISYFWSNLGTLLRRMESRQAAELAYRVALEINPGDLTAISNAARLYKELGEDELATRFTEKAEYYRNRNPYFQYKQGLEAFLQGDYAGAMRHARRAIRLYDKEHRFHFLQGIIHLQSGDRKQAQESLQKAIDISTDEKQQDNYRRKRDYLLAGSASLINKEIEEANEQLKRYQDANNLQPP